jgi:PIN domain nuclease of toxin-antitoxin system
MKVLIDAHAIVWWMTSNSRLSSTARRLMGSSEHQRFLSLASLWELSLKVNTGRRKGLGSTIESLRQTAAAQAISILPITYEHILRVESLPLHHADPFDRMLIAQALEGDLTLLSADGAFSRYSVPLIW